MAHWRSGNGCVFIAFALLLFKLDRNGHVCLAKKHRRPEFCDHLKVSEQGSFLWMVKTEPPSYFFGTIHVPYTRVWDYIPENTKKALQMSDSVYFELDLTDSKTIAALTMCQLLPKGRNLSEMLPEDLFSRLKEHLAYIRDQMPRWITNDQKGRGLYADYLFNAITGNWQRKRPVWVMLMVNSLTESDIRSRGVPVLDLYLAKEAERLSKKTGAVEQVDEQCVPLNRLNFSQGVFALNHTLWQQESLRAGGHHHTYTTDDLIKHYNCGDLDAVIFSQDTAQVPHLGNSSLSPLEAATAQHIDAYFRQELIYRRNERMGNRVVEILRQNPGESFFFAFGAGHFLGNHTVLDVVRLAGLEIEHVGPEQRLRRHKRRRGSKGGFVPELTMLKDFSSDTQNLEANHQHDSAFAKFLLSEQHTSSELAGMHGGWDMRRYPTTFSPYKKKSNFNDLWVKIDTDVPGDDTLMGPEDVPPEDAAAGEKSLRVWYGLPINSGNGCRRGDELLIQSLFVLICYVLWVDAT